MVQLASCCIERHILLRVILCIVLIGMPASVMYANIFDDAVDGLKSAGDAIESVSKDALHAVEGAANDVVDFVKARFRDTKVTRSVDYGIRKAALETALVSAQGILTFAEKTADVTLDTAEKTAQLGITAGSKFLSEVVQKASPQILEGSAQAAKGILEGAKQTGIGVLKGSQWVVENALGTFDLNQLRYQGDLRSLKKGILGNILCEGIVFGQHLSVRFDLDPSDMTSVLSSIKPILTSIEDIFNHKVAPQKEDKERLAQTKAVVDQASSVVQQGMPVDVTAALEQERLASSLVQQLTDAEKQLVKQLDTASAELRNIALKKSEELKSMVATKGKQGVAARQELVKRAGQK